MPAKNIFIIKRDFEKLNELLGTFKPENSKDMNFVEKLKQELARAKMVSSKKIPADIVIIKSRVLLEDLDTNKEFIFQVVFPSDADLDAGKISVLSPIGTALLGYQIGDTIEWEVPGGIRKLKIKKMLYQPKENDKEE